MRWRKQNHWVLFTLAAVIPVAGICIGCGGPGLSTVEGTVTFEGEPVGEGAIVFEPADGIGRAAGGTIRDGRYQLTGEAGVEPGPKIVRITASRKTGNKVEPMPGAPEVDEVLPYIPAKYNQMSELTVDIGEGIVTHNFELTE